MKKALLLLATAIAFAGCSKNDGPDQTTNRVLIAINAIQNKSTATDITIPGELTPSELETLKSIRSQLPKVENITLPDVKVLEFGVFVYKEGILHVANYWLKNISAPKLEVLGESALWCCENMESVNFPRLATIQDEALAGSGKLTSLNLPSATTIGDKSFGACHELRSIKFGALTEIHTLSTSFDGIETKSIDLLLGNYEASQSVGKIWKSKTWKSISNTDGQVLPDPDFGVANFGCTKDFIIQNEKGKPVSGGVIYEGSSGSAWWYIYNFDANDKFISGTTDYSFQFASTPTEWVFLPIRQYVDELNNLKKKFGDPTYASEDVLSFNMTDKTIQPGYAWYEAQSVMNGSKQFTYKFSNSTTNIESILSFYLRSDKYHPWGFTMRTTYSKK